MTPDAPVETGTRLPVAGVARRIREQVETLPPTGLEPRRARGRVLAEPLTVRESLPRFDQSAMDGYAVRSGDLLDASPGDPVRLVCERSSPAGEQPEGPFEDGEAVRIYTGGPVPGGADAVVAQEDVTRDDEGVRFTEPASPGQHIRYEAEELERGQVLLKRGTVLNTGGIGLALSQGYRELPVHQTPDVSVFSLGDEIIDPERDPGPAQKRDTNAPMVAGLLREAGCSTEEGRLPDDPRILEDRFGERLERDDLLVLIGGASVGDRDYVRPVLKDLGVETVFWKVNQKPGKPLYLGKRDSSLVLGLPGNPVSALVSFYLHGLALVRRMSGYPDDCLYPARVTTRLSEDYRKRSDRTEFVRARTHRRQSGFSSTPLSHQGSHMLSGAARANSLLILPDDQFRFEAGDRLECYLLFDSVVPDGDPVPGHD